jgi:DNA-directed RNA polymerase specialized sigma24 family protein
MFQDNEQQLKELYISTLPRVARMVRRMGGDLELARDVFQDAVIIYLEKQQQNTIPEGVVAGAYITGIARILCIRKLKRQGHELPLEAAGQYAVPENYFDPPPAEKSLLGYLKSAGSRCMELLQAFYYEHQSLQEIANSFRFRTLHSASVQKYKCLEKIRQQVKHTDYAETVS